MNRIIIAIVIMILGLLVILVPTVILPVCSPTEIAAPMESMHTSISMTMKYMACHWTAQAEIGIGAVIIALGLLMLLSKSALVRLGLSLSLICLAILVAAIPTVLIGVCPSEMMHCRIGTLPALLLLSGVIFIVALVNSIYLKKSANNVA